LKYRILTALCLSSFVIACAQNDVTAPSRTTVAPPSASSQSAGEAGAWSTNSLVADVAPICAAVANVSPPTNLVITVTGTAVALSWTAPADGSACTYMIEVGSAPGLANLGRYPSTTTNFGGAAPNGIYYVRVRSLDANGVQSAQTSNESVATVTPSGGPLTFNAPQPPNGRVGDAYFFSFCGLPDSNGANCAGGANLFGGVGPYHFQLDTFGGFPPIGLILAPNGALSGTPSGRVTNHTFKVCAVDTTGTNRCPTVTISILPREGSECTVAPAPPTGVSVSVTGTTVAVNWSGANGATSYVLEAGTVPGSTNAFNSDIGNLTSLTAPGIPLGTFYIRIRAKNACGTSAVSSEVTARVGPPPTQDSTYIAEYRGTGSYFRSSNGCTWTPTYSGTITVALTQAGAAGTVRVTGVESVPLGSTPTPNFTCTASSFAFDVTEPLTVSGGTFSRNGMSIEASTGSFSGTLSGNTISGTFNLTYTRGVGSISMPVTLRRTNDLPLTFATGPAPGSIDRGPGMMGQR
jgi:hypothetical protein